MFKLDLEKAEEPEIKLPTYAAAAAAAAAAKSLQPCPTLCDPHRQQPTRLPCPWDSPGKNTGVGCHFLLQCMKVECESEVAQLLTFRCWPIAWFSGFFYPLFAAVTAIQDKRLH